MYKRRFSSFGFFSSSLLILLLLLVSAPPVVDGFVVTRTKRLQKFSTGRQSGAPGRIENRNPSQWQQQRHILGAQQQPKSASSALSMTVSCKDSTQKTFRGKNVLLTGASGGLGRALALELAAAGCSCLVLSARKLESLQAVADECTSLASNSNNPSLEIHCIPCDLSKPDSVTALAQTALEKCPQIDVLINNGGVSSRSRFVDTTEAVDRQVMQINFLSGAALAKAVVPGMVEKQDKCCRIIWISSVQGLVGIPNRSSYAASKFAVQGYCESIRAELASSGIAVHCVSPGYIRTNLSRSALTGDGTPHGVMDATTEAGQDPHVVAVNILDRVAANEMDFTVAATTSAVAAIWLRLLCPGILRSLLVKRYEKSVAENVKEKKD